MIEDTKETPGALDAFETLKPGERHWTLQEFHPLSPLTMIFWAQAARLLAGVMRDETFIDTVYELLAKVERIDRDKQPEERDELLTRATHTETMAWDFQAAQKGQQSQSEHDQTQHKGESKEEMEWRLAHFNLRTHIIARLHNALAEANDQIEGLKELDPQGESADIEYAANRIIAGVAELKLAANMLEPKRKIGNR